MTWIRLDDLAQEYTLFSKDRNQDTNGVVMRAFVFTSGFLGVRMYDSDDWSTHGELSSTGANIVMAEEWVHIGYSIDMSNNAQDTDVRLWTNDNSGETITNTGVFYLDDTSAYPCYVGCYRDSTTTYAQHFKGFMYTLDVYNIATGSGSPRYGNTSCSGCSVGGKCTTTTTNCLEDYNFTEYSDGQSCTGCAGIGCVRVQTCQTCSGFDYCHLCNDRECTQCSDYFSTDCSSCDTNSTINSGGCVCNDNYGRSDVDETCKQCHFHCKSCDPGANPDYRDCSECMPGTYDTSPVGSYTYCTTYCPSGFDASGCTLPTNTMILSYTFDKPLTAVPNDGSASSTFDVTLTTANPSAHPAKDRGIYFDGAADGFVEIPTLFLPHTFSVNAWVQLKGIGISQNIFAKTRNDFTNLVNVGLNASNNFTAKLTLDTDASTESVTSDTTVATVDTWYYLVYSFEMTTGKDTNIELFVNNVSSITDTWTGRFLIDGSSYSSIIGAKKTAASTYDTKWNGYIYDLHIYVAKHTTGNVAHASVCSSCSTLDFDQYDDSGVQTCTGTNCTDRSCVKSGECLLISTCEGGSFCHLCLDRECKQCSDYTSCDTNKCLQSGFAQESGGACSCQTTYGRPAGTNNLCAACKSPCLTCDQGGLSYYTDCLTCDSTHYELNDLDGTHKYCISYCPTLYNGAVPNCVPPASSYLLFDQAFNTFVGPWTSSAGLVATSVGPYPSKERGHYFNAVNQHMTFSDFLLRPSFSLMAWVRFDDLTADYTIFSKDRNTASDNLVFAASIEITTGNLKISLSHALDSFATVQTATSTTQAVTADTWTHVGYSLALATTADAMEYRLWTGSNAGDTGTISSYTYTDDATA